MDTTDRIDGWLFDLDNTLYPARCNLFAQVDIRINAFVRDFYGVGTDNAREIQKRLFLQYGSTLRGLMVLHDLDPNDYLDFVHDIDYSPVPAEAALDHALGRLGGRKFVFTAGSTRHAEAVLDRLGVARHFEAIHDIAAAAYLPKPDMRAYRGALLRFGLEPSTTAMVEDLARNLAPAHELGMTTVWVPGHPDWRDADMGQLPAHVHHVAEDLPAWLATIAPALRPRPTAELSA
jgi:putative hydrolase of the HAD superfamily